MQLKDVVFHEEEVPLSDKEIQAFTDGRTNVVMYEDLTTLPALLGDNGQYILLYRFPGKDVGHWVCGWFADGALHHFDPLGNGPDHYTDLTKYTELCQSAPRFVTNKVAFQQQREKVNTCGRHCMVRLLFRDHSNEEYQGLMGRALRLKGADELVTMITLASTLHANKK